MSKRQGLTIVGLPLFMIAGLIFTLLLCLHEKSSAVEQSFLTPILGISESDTIKFDADTGNYRIQYTGIDGVEKYWIFEPANKVNVEVLATVEYDSVTDVYTYNYRIVNDKTSKQKTFRFGVQYDADIFNPSSPEEWRFCKSAIHRNVAVWGDVDEERNGIQPGDAQDHFSFQSKGAPGTVKCYAQGYTDIPSFSYGEAPEDVRPNFFGNCVVGNTIGPVGK